jgi:toxin FitB
MYLLDTNVISEAFRGSPQVKAWLDREDSKPHYMSVISLGEIERGVVLLQSRDSIRAEKLAKWLAGLRVEYSKKMLPVDEKVSMVWGQLSARKERGDADGLIAATALVHQLIVVTRNTRDFEYSGVKLINPWNEVSPGTQ